MPQRRGDRIPPSRSHCSACSAGSAAAPASAERPGSRWRIALVWPSRNRLTSCFSSRASLETGRGWPALPRQHLAHVSRTCQRPSRGDSSTLADRLVPASRCRIGAIGQSHARWEGAGPPRLRPPRDGCRPTELGRIIVQSATGIGTACQIRAGLARPRASEQDDASCPDGSRREGDCGRLDGAIGDPTGCSGRRSLYRPAAWLRPADSRTNGFAGHRIATSRPPALAGGDGGQRGGEGLGTAEHG